jgi:RNA polymerase sigma-70 factor, ECF subfamily
MPARRHGTDANEADRKYAMAQGQATQTEIAVGRSGAALKTRTQSVDLEMIFSRYADPVYRFLYARLGNREDAEDLTSEVFLKATRGLDGNRTEASMAAWIFTVARTVLADHWRKYYRTGAVLPLDDEGYVPTAGEPVSPTENSSQMVNEILASLPDRYRKVLELRFIRGYSVQETAQELGVTPGNVKVMQHRALAKAAQLGIGMSAGEQHEVREERDLEMDEPRVDSAGAGYVARERIFS